METDSRTWQPFNQWYDGTYALDIHRENAGEFDALRALMEEHPDHPDDDNWQAHGGRVEPRNEATEWSRVGWGADA